MLTIPYVEVNLFCASVLLVILLSTRRHGEKLFFEQRVFEGMVVCNLMLVLMDMLGWLVNGKSGALNYHLNSISMLLFYSFGAIIGPLYILYCDCRISTPRDEMKKRMRWYFCVGGVVLLGVLFNIFMPVYFSISPNNVYSRGALFPLSMLQLYGCLIYGLLRVAKAFSRKNLSRKDRRMLHSLLFFPLPPLLASFLQLRFYGLSTVWQFSVISMLIAFLNVQSDDMRTDALTGLLNRRELLPYIEGITEHLRENNEQKLYLIMADIDDFKKINDLYGHSVGDEAIIVTSRILRQCSGSDDIIVRYGGDEFVIIGLCDSIAEANALMRRIQKSCQLFSRGSGGRYSLSLSMGLTLWDREKYENADAFISAADARMYDEKKKKKCIANKALPQQA